MPGHRGVRVGGSWSALHSPWSVDSFTAGLPQEELRAMYGAAKRSTVANLMIQGLGVA